MLLAQQVRPPTQGPQDQLALWVGQLGLQVQLDSEGPLARAVSLAAQGRLARLAPQDCKAIKVPQVRLETQDQREQPV